MNGRDVSVMRRMRLLFWPASYKSMAASSLVGFVFQVEGIAFYGSAASFNSALCVIWSPQQVLFEL